MTELTQLGEIGGAMALQREVDRMIHGHDFKSVVMNQPNFRPGTELPVIRTNMVFSAAGMGDYIAYMPAMVWLAKNCPWVYGRIFAPRFFNEFAKNIMAQTGNDNWRVWPGENFDELAESGSLNRGPGIKIKGKVAHQMANGTGGHLVDVGFLYFVNLFPVPPGAEKYPQIDFKLGLPAFPVLTSAPSTYVCITPGGVSPARTVPGHYWNPIIDYLERRGLTVVFLGKSEMSKDHKVAIPSDVPLNRGVNLIDKTTMMEAAWIMKHAWCTIGLDNGLLHLAACTDANVIAAYNTVAPYEREPARDKGHWISITPTRDELPCTNCQTEYKSFFPHNFRTCLYKDNQCIDLLFELDGSRFRAAIDRMFAMAVD